MALYLITSPHSNMIGLYHQPLPYMGYETGLGEEGARKGLQHCIDVRFCSYDTESEMVWVHEMAAWQVADELKPADLRCKGIQKLYDSLPSCPFLVPFFERYSAPFHMRRCRTGTDSDGVDGELFPESLQAPTQAPSKPGAGAGAGAGADVKEAPSDGASQVTLRTWLKTIKAKGEKAVPDGDPVFAYAEQVGLPNDFLELAWLAFRHRYTEAEGTKDKRYKAWRKVFLKAVRENWLKLWWLQGEVYTLTTAGVQAQREFRSKVAA